MTAQGTRQHGKLYAVSPALALTLVRLQNNFLPLPAKQAEPLPDLGDKIRLYIQHHFNDTHPDAFKHDIAQLSGLRKQFIEGGQGPEVHREVVTGLSK